MKPAANGREPVRVRHAAAVGLAAGLAVALCGALYLRETQEIEQRQQEREAARVDIYAQALRGELRPVARDLRELATGDGLAAFLATGAPADHERAVRRAVFYSQLQPAYDKVRFLDERGHEDFRVNRGGAIVSAAELQDMSDRPFFGKAWALPAGEIYQSAFDLNVEHDRVELPIKPTLRFSTPVTDAAGRKRGVYAINYLGGELLARLQRSVPAYANRLRVLNADGYWIKAADAVDEWGFMLPDRADRTLAHTDPELWARIQREPQGQVRHVGGLFSWERVAAVARDEGAAEEIIEGDQYLILASEVSAAEWDGFFASLRRIFLLVTPVLALLAGGGAWLLLARRRALRAMQESEARYRSLFNSIDEGFCVIEMIFDADGRSVDYRFLEINAAFERQTGLHDAQGKRMRELAPQHEAHWFEIYGRIALTGQPERFQNRAEQLHRTYDVYAFRFGDAADRRVGILFNDITQRRKAEEELERFFSLSLDFLCISSPDGYFKRVSPGVTEMLGWTVDEFLATPYLELVHPDDVPATLREVEQQMRDGQKVLNFENRYRHKDGSWRVLSWRSVPDQSSDLMYATARDVTESKHHADRIHELNLELQRQAGQLVVANKELEAFSYSVSHDLRAPLRHIQGYVEMLTREAKDGLSEKALRYLRTIAEAGGEMGVLIDDLLAFSRMGRTEMVEEDIDLGPLIAEARRGLELATQGRNIRWQVAGLPPVRGDAAMLRQVLVNLLANAVKYSRGRDPAEITIGCAGEEEGRLVFFVRDNGAGFDMKYADKLFGVFQRLHRADEFEGTGIGLASVRRIIARHGGRTWGEGRLNAGATFYFTLHPWTPPAATP